MENISIREYIINNFKEGGKEEIQKAIETSIDAKEEEALPGMGVFFEILWKNSDEEKKQHILDTLEKNIKTN